ncbi:MAG: ATP-binding cassette domain-containing protein [Clostridia bacterium]|nr:ATP-binding cassette domain-containing protein [Clostridia bacterium]
MPFHYLVIRHEYIVTVREERHLIRPISFINNILKPLHKSFVKREEMYAKVIKIAEILGLEEYLGKKPGAMSGGQRQRVALGRAMVRNPKVFLLDEPLSNLDAKLRTQMRSEITKLHNRLQTTFIYVTHDQVEAMTMGDRIVVMKKGRIQQIDTPVNLYSYPENIFVAGFIGTPSMNFFTAKVESDGKKANVVFANDKKIEFNPESIKKLERKYLGKEITMGVRPEDFVLSDDGVECVVLNTEMLGSETLIYCDFDTTNVTNYESGKYPFIIKIEGICPHKCGDVIKVSIDFEKAHYFDNESEESVMKRFVSYNDLPVTVSGGKLNLGGKTVALPPVLAGLDGNLDAVFPTAAVYEGSDFDAEVLECEQLKQGWLARILIGSQKLYALFDKEVSGKIKVSLNWHEITFNSNGETVKAALSTENIFDVKLNKRALTSEQKKQLPVEEKRTFDVDVLCGETALTCPLSVLKRLLSASDRKLFGIDMQLIFDANKITADKTFTAQIKEKYDYGNKQYALCECKGKQIVLPFNGETSEISFGIDLLNAGIYDNNLGIKIA